MTDAGRDAPLPPQVFRDNLTIAAARPDWVELLAAYEMNALVVGRTA